MSFHNCIYHENALLFHGVVHHRAVPGAAKRGTGDLGSPAPVLSACSGRCGSPTLAALDFCYGKQRCFIEYCR